MNGWRFWITALFVAAVWSSPVPTVFAGPARIAIAGGQVAMTGEEIRLGDLAEIQHGNPQTHERLASVSLGAAPKPGKSKFLEAGFIQTRLSEEGFSLKDVELDIPDKVEVVRESRTIGEPEVREQVVSILVNRLMPASMEMKVKDFRLLSEVVLPAGPYTLTVETPPRSRMMGPVALHLLFQSHDGYRLKARAAVKLEVESGVVMTTRAIESGGEITEGDLKITRADLSSLPATVVTDPRGVIGKKLKRHIPAMTVLRTDLIDTPPLVVKGDIVTICAESGGLRVTALGEAREDGREGEQIRVTNLDSKKDLYVRVTDNRTVEAHFK